MQITAAMVKELRERSGAGMMECKKALTEVGGDVEAGIEWLRKQGLAKADKKASRVAAEGRIALAETAGRAVLVEINCETDFVAKDENFVAFCDRIAQAALDAGVKDVEALATVQIDGQSVDERRQTLIAKIGENIQLRRLISVDADAIGAYLHGSRIGVVVALEGGDADLGRDLAMHIAAMKPPYISADDVPADVIENERAIFAAQVAESGKPAEIIAKMVDGKLRKSLAEITLLGQPFVKDGDTTVENLLKKHGAKVIGFTRFEVGEGIEKKEENFAAEVMAQVQASK
jgi:elongation factor Ts